MNNKHRILKEANWLFLIASIFVFIGAYVFLITNLELAKFLLCLGGVYFLVSNIFLLIHIVVSLPTRTIYEEEKD